MFYPEGEIAFCSRCRADIQPDHHWRGTGSFVRGRKLSKRTLILYNRCHECGCGHSYGLEGRLAYRLLYSWIWSLRYPRRKPIRGATKEVEHAYEAPRRRAVGE
jgi:hypothetical protein